VIIIKSPREIEQMRRSNLIVAEVFQGLKKVIGPGISTKELDQITERIILLKGAVPAFKGYRGFPASLCVSINEEIVHGIPSQRRLREGDIVIGEITPVYEGQFIQICRTVVLGKANPVLIEKYEMLIHALEESFEQIRPGAPASMISIAMNRVISNAGYAKYCSPPYMRSRGHGFGVGSIAPGPEIDEKMKVNLEKHQVVAVHPNQYLPETGYLACGETVMVTETGMERLAKTETRLYIKEG
jgi:methionine aminopeptidase